MVWHQTPPENVDPVPSAVIGQKVAIVPVISVAKKGPCPPVAALGYMVRNIRKNNAGEAGHAWKLTKIKQRVN